MRQFIQAAYTFSLRAQGGYLILLALLTLGVVPTALIEGTSWTSYLIVGAIALVIALFLVLPGLTPSFLARPSGMLRALGAMLSSSGILIVAVLAGYAGIIGLGLPEPLSRSVAITTALPTLLFTGLMWWLALALGVLPQDTGLPPAARPPRVTPKRPEQPSAYQRALRQKQSAQV